MNSQFTVAAHVMAMIAWVEREKGRPATSQELADSAGTHPVFVRDILSVLASANLVKGRRGRGGGTVLARDPREITLAHVYEAFRQDVPLLGQHPGAIGQDCPAAPIIETYLTETFADGEAQLVAALSKRTIDAMSRHVVQQIRARHSAREATSVIEEAGE